ncbi:MAG: ATP-grasp domain-containing protein, partial [Pseudomonadota bacterium]
MTEPLAPGATIGILGGGQLGRMLSVAASRLGLRCHVFEPGAGAPAGQVAEQVVTAPYEDDDALRTFAASVDVITYEFENIPTRALDVLESLRPIRPGREALRVSQDRLTEKRFLADLGLRTAPFAEASDATRLQAALETVGTPSILKTRRFGYDGKGQARIMSPDAAEGALASLEGADAILEGFVTFDREISVIAARGIDGQVACFDPGENV